MRADRRTGGCVRLPHAHQRPGVRRRAGRSSSARSRPRRRRMPPHSSATALLERFRAMVARRRADRRRRRRHRPVGQVRGGGRHRPDRDLQFRPLPHGRARLARRPAGLRQRQRDRHGDGARGAAGGASTRRCWPASTAPTRSCCCDQFLRRAEGAWASPACRTSRPSACSTARSAQSLEETGMGYGARGRHDRARRTRSTC